LDAVELSARVISGNTQELHVVADDGDFTHEDTVREHVLRVDRRHKGARRGVRGVEEEEEGFRPSCEPAVGSLEAFGRKHKGVKKHG